MKIVIRKRALVESSIDAIAARVLCIVEKVRLVYVVAKPFATTLNSLPGGSLEGPQEGMFKEEEVEFGVCCLGYVEGKSSQRPKFV